MMEEFYLDDRDDSLKGSSENVNNLLHNFKRQINRYSKAHTAADKDRKKKDAEQTEKQLFTALDEFQHALQIANARERSNYELNYDKLKDKFYRYRSTLEKVKSGPIVDRSKQLFDGGHQVQLQQQQQQPKYHDGIDTVIQIQKEGIDILDSLQESNDEIINIATRAAAKLKQQRERLNYIDQELQEIGTGMKRARREMRSLYRHLACSKVVICMMVTVSLLLVICLLLRFILAAFGVKLFGGENSIIKKKKTNPSPSPAPTFTSLLYYH
jgi:uncharacterized phage infection (PIP) family protein YhgE